MCFDAVGFAVSAAGMILGAEFVLIGLGLYTVKTVLANADWFAAEIPGSAFVHKPGPHVFLEKMLEEMDDDDYAAMVKEMGSHGSAGLQDGFKQMAEDLDELIREGQEKLWDIRRAPGCQPDQRRQNVCRATLGPAKRERKGDREAVARSTRVPRQGVGR